jgi:hypothetical protein
MSVDFESEVSAALHDVADDLPPPPLDFTRVRRGGRRRRAGAIAFAALTAAMAVGAVAGVVRLVAPAGTTQDAAAGTGSGTVVAAAAMSNVQAFYSGYQAATRKGKGAVNGLIKARVASWYAPVLEAPATASFSPVECGNVESAGLYYQKRGEVAGQLVFVVGSPLWHSSHPTQPEFNVVVADPANARITGISCTVGGPSVPASGGQRTAIALYQIYLLARRHGLSVHTELAGLLDSQPPPGSAYLHQANYAAVTGRLTYDPLVCTSSPVLPDVTVRPVATVADGTASLVKITPAGNRPVLAVVTRSAGNRLMVEDLACQQPAWTAVAFRA